MPACTLCVLHIILDPVGFPKVVVKLSPRMGFGGQIYVCRLRERTWVDDYVRTCLFINIDTRLLLRGWNSTSSKELVVGISVIYLLILGSIYGQILNCNFRTTFGPQGSLTIEEMRKWTLECLSIMFRKEGL